MSKTPFSKICELLGALYGDHDDSWNAFFEINDLGLPLAYAVCNFYVSDLTSSGTRAVEETWANLLEHVGVPDDEYLDWDSIVEASSVLRYPS